MSSVSIGSGRSRYDEEPDRALVAMSRRGDTGAFSTLWRRHRLAAFGAARLASRTVDADDLVAEAYAVILAAIRRGGGPTGDGFRAYLCATVRNLARRWGSSRRELAVEEVPEDADADEVLDGQLDSLDERLVREAFHSLPRRWQEVLWRTEVEGLGPADIARRFDITPNAAAVLAFRAREGLRRAWLQAHVADMPPAGECRWVLAHIGEHSRDGLRKRAAARVDAHLAACRGCRDIALEVGQVNARLARILLPLLAGGGAAAAWLGAPVAPVAAAVIATAATALAIAVGSGSASVATAPDPAEPMPPIEQSEPLASVGPVAPARLAEPGGLPERPPAPPAVEPGAPLVEQGALAVEAAFPPLQLSIPPAGLGASVEVGPDVVSIVVEGPVIGGLDVAVGLRSPSLP